MIEQGHQKTQDLTQKTLLQFCSKFFKVTKASSRRFCLLPIIMKSHRRAAAVAAAAADGGLTFIPLALSCPSGH